MPLHLPSSHRLCCYILLGLLALLQSHSWTNAVIYLEDVHAALLHDDVQDMSPPHQFSTLTAAPSTTASPSSSNVFDRRLRSTNDTSLIGPFDDLATIESPSAYVYYDCKQARFGTDLGPQGNYEVGNIVLPPRGLWGDDDDDLHTDDDRNRTGIPTKQWDVSGVNEERLTTEINAESNHDSNLSLTWPIDNEIYASDYFCLEDFVKWKSQLQQQPAHLVRNGISETFQENSNIKDGQFNNPNYIHSIRPLTILAMRGRCSFESKAQMAMLLNEVFLSQGKSNRIGHIIVYNNLTGDDSTHDETLIEMGLVATNQALQESTTVSSQHQANVQNNYEYTVGMVYITSHSGQDLIRRMKERAASVGIYPHLNIGGMFEGDTAAVDKDERAFRKREGKGVNVEESTKGEYNDTILQVQELFVHDPLITNGWFFPATLTRFCLSCGPEQSYGFDTTLLTNLVDKTDHGGQWGWFNGGWEHPPQDLPTPDDIVTDSAVYDPYDGYYIPKEWADAVRKLMISIMALLLIGPLVFLVWRWHSVGGTIRLVRDENGLRRLRLISPNLEIFINGIPATVEANGTKLDRSQVFALPEMEYVSAPDGGVRNESGLLCEVNNNASTVEERQDENTPQTTPDQIAWSQCLESGYFVSSTCCSICIEEFIHGEKLRMLPRCAHAFHTECLLPWLTERQGCCPLCKTPVLPDEYQRNRRNSRFHLDAPNSPRNGIIRNIFRQPAIGATSEVTGNEVQHDVR